ncbi:MAG TPA: pectinesterase family protein [Roseiflexaceae bacterium]|nr:pectinesterase family protein [Roseiflexaceae bacterium]
MRRLVGLLLVTCLLAVGSAPPAAAQEGGLSATGLGGALGQSLGRQTLPANDGWAASGAGTTGGAAAAADRVFVVSNRQQLVAALANADPTPKIIYVRGTIDGNVDDAGQPLTCDSYAAPGYSLAAYLAAYDPAVWGRSARPSGPLEDARVASQRAQAARIRIKVGSNTTLVGLGADATVQGINLDVNQVSNVIIRNITFQDAFDCFPQWDPTDGSTGNWNSQYDTVSLTAATNVWVDHNAFNDGDNPDSAQPVYFGRPYQVHDGALDITRGSDLVTVSWNHFSDHDKVMLIGSTDSPTYDVGKLRVTLHHNLFANVGQRVPRVRYGQVHVYNNYYDISNPASYIYSWGVGVQSQIYAQNNFFRAPPELTPDRFLRRFNGTAISVAGTLLNGRSAADRVDLLAAYNAANDPDLLGEVGWQPTLVAQMLPTQTVPTLVGHLSGPFPSALVVAQDGSSDFATVQSAVNAIPDGAGPRVVVLLKPGVYREVLKIPASKPPISLVGLTLDPKAVVITYDNASGTPKPDGGTYGTSGSATATISSNDFHARNLTFENSFDEQANPQMQNRQAVALKTEGDRMVFDNVRLIGNQDTLYANSVAVGSAARQLFRNCFIEGDVDFIFGRATAVFDRCIIRALDRGSTSNNGYVTAASTPQSQQYGFLIIRSTIVSDAPAQTFYLGRPWHPGGDPTAIGQVVVRDSWLAAAVKTAPWTDMSGFSWREARFAEYHNSGPGAAPGPDRPLLTAAQAAAYTVDAYLAGADGWQAPSVFALGE